MPQNFGCSFGDNRAQARVPCSRGSSVVKYLREWDLYLDCGGQQRSKRIHVCVSLDVALSNKRQYSLKVTRTENIEDFRQRLIRAFPPQP
jgi:hypothetical protein